LTNHNYHSVAYNRNGIKEEEGKTDKTGGRREQGKEAYTTADGVFQGYHRPADRIGGFPFSL
jgi:hypothetical protein